MAHSLIIVLRGSSRLGALAAGGQAEPSQEMMRVLQRAKKLQKKRGDSYLGVDVLLCALLQALEVKEAVAEAGLSPQQLEAAVEGMRGADSKARAQALHPEPLCASCTFYRFASLAFYGKASVTSTHRTRS